MDGTNTLENIEVLVFWDSGNRLLVEEAVLWHSVFSVDLVLILGVHHASALYGVVHKSLRDFRPLRFSSRNGHAEGERVNRGRDTPRFCPALQVLICPPLVTRHISIL
jgi:hypothetical protein